MKKVLGTLLLFLILNSGCANAKEFLIPSDIELVSIVDYIAKEAGLNFVNRFIFIRIIKNLSLDGIKIKEYSVDGIISYFNSDKLFKKPPKTTFTESHTGITLDFKSDGKCKKENKCYVLIDLNGDSPPNEIWTKKTEPKDRIMLKILKVDSNMAKISY